MSYTVVRSRRPAPEHLCDLPGFFGRLNAGLRRGAQVRCGCGQLWEWKDTGWTDVDMRWVKVDPETEEGEAKAQ